MTPFFASRRALATAALPLALLAACGEAPSAPSVPDAPEAASRTPSAALAGGGTGGGGTTEPQPVCNIITGCPVIVASRKASLFESRIWLMSTNGTLHKQLTSGAIDRNPAISPDGKKVAFLSNRDGGSLYVVNIDGTGMLKVASAPGVARGVSWSPDGTSIAFSATPGTDGEIFVAKAAGGVVSQLTIDTNDDHSPAYAPNGTIVFSSDRGTGPTKNLELWRWNGPNSFTRLTQTDYDELDPAFSPDGTKLAYVIDWSGDWMSVVVGDAAGANPKDLHTVGGSNHKLASPSFSKDGKSLVYARMSFG